MSSPHLAIPDSPQQQGQVQTGAERQPETNNIQQQAIANLAYELCQQRGCAVGSPEDDWNRAEALLQAGERNQLSAPSNPIDPAGTSRSLPDAPWHEWIREAQNPEFWKTYSGR